MNHDHYSGKYRGAAQSICNLRYLTQKDIPVLIHNGSNYDFKLLIREFANQFRTDMKCVGENREIHDFFNTSKERKYQW